MKKTKEQLILRKDDYELLVNYLKGNINSNSFDKHNAEELSTELKKAKLVNDNQFPEDVVGLNSKVTIKDESEDKTMAVTLVKPDMSDIKEKKISIMSPIGTALIGFRKGQKVKWKVPAGMKTFLIVDVDNYNEMYKA
jgi:regulator of nucleoside diphosphate kinase